VDISEAPEPTTKGAISHAKKINGTFYELIIISFSWRRKLQLEIVFNFNADLKSYKGE
jgi:hypothetical protein